ncbi:hypothetical protein AKJ65_04150 [candidate division MSBL1 archaeon SCGC-AAA259E19]|uniref:Uncharacterized protein n=1 Tax=candidate division MSBL1 archaeon SCGC-AAA259E19 TaxID=1698264 RepID=A0A133UJZ3_9EURY|nr:hypothetical protein AKJ65_04150 [candidate division MSBL1 archaeon SCGC-AAA259E19]
MNEKFDERGVSSTVIIAVIIIGIASVVGATALYSVTRPEPNFKVKNLSISRKKVAKGVPLTAQVRVANVGDARGTHTIKLKLNGQTLKEEVTLEAGEFSTLDFGIEKQEIGTYSLNIEDLSESFEVVEPAKFELSNLQVSPKEAKPGETVTVTADVQNTGEIEGAHRVELEVGGTVEKAENIELAPNETSSVSFTLSRETSESYSVKLGKLSGSFRVLEPARFETSNFRVSPKSPVAGEEFTASVDVKNVGEIEGTYKAVWKVEGDVDDTQEVALDPGESRTVTFSMVWNESGTYSVSLSGMSKIVTVLAPAKFEVRDLDINPSKVAKGENVEVKAKIANVGDIKGTRSITLEVEGGPYSRKELTLGSGEVKTLSFTVMKQEKGKYNLRVGDLSRTIKVVEPAKFEVSNLRINLSDPSGEKNFTEEMSLNQASGEIEAIDFSPNNEYVAYGSRDSKIYVHSTDDWSLISSSTEDDVKVRGLSFSPNGKYLAFTYEDKSNLYVYSTSTWNKVATLTRSGGEVKSFSFSPNSDYIAYSSQDTNVYIHSTNDWSNVATFTQSSLPTWRVIFSPDGQYFAFGDGGWRYNVAHTYVYSVSDWNNLATFTAGGWVRGIDFTSNSDRMAFCSNDRKVRIYSTGTWEKIKRLTTGKKVRHVDFSPDGEMIGYGANSTAYVSSTSDWSLEKKFTDQRRYVFNTVFSPDSKYFVYNSSGTGKVFVYSTEDWSEVKTFNSSRGRFDFSSDGSMFAIQSDETVRVYRITSGVNPGEPVNISADVSNTGGLPGDYKAKLKINGVVENTQNVSLDSGETTTVSFTVRRETSGTYSLELGGLTSSFEVLEPAVFEVSGLSVSPSKTSPGEPVDISVDVRNTGEASGEYSVELKVDGSVEKTRTVTLAGGESTTVSFTVKKNDEKEYSVSVGDLSDSFEVTSGELTSHAPIKIDGNSDFSDGDDVGVINPGATGTESDPYIIENWITDASSDDGIWIEDTTVHFIIRNCAVEKGGNSYDGIHLSNVTNGGIENNRFYGNNHGVFLKESTNNTIKNNTVENSSSTAIRLTSICKHNTIRNNVVRNSDGGGIGLNGARTEWNIIENNTLEDGSTSGISLNCCDHNTVKNNFVENYFKGIRSSTVKGWKGKYHTIENNTCKKNSNGIFLYNSSKNTIVNNTCSNNDNGIVLTGDSDGGYSNNNVLYHNTIRSNSQFNAFDEGHNTWESVALDEGNYWSDWRPPEHPDADNDGIVDEPRPIRGGNNYDNYPLAISETQPSENISRYFEWTDHLSEEWSWELNIELRRYQYYQTLSHTAYSKEDYLEFVTYQDGLVKHMADELSSMYSDPDNESNYALSFVQSLGYLPENEEYIRYPVETLVDNGDCEDTAILYVALMKAAGHDVALIDFENHMMAGVNLSELPQYGNQEYIHWFEENGKRYYTCETTGIGWHVGDLPEQYQGESARVYIVD